MTTCCAGECALEAFAGDGVDAGGARCGEDVVAGVAEVLDELRADEAGAADDGDVHGRGWGLGTGGDWGAGDCESGRE